MKNKNQLLQELIVEAEKVTQESQTIFGNLKVEQLNWKPEPNQWSIAQCFDHVRTANASYFPIFEQIISGKKKSTIWERMPLLPRFWGKMLIKSISPQSQPKLKAPKMFHPSNSNIDANIIVSFIEQQNQVTNYMKVSQDLDLHNIIISSPVASFITYSLLDAFTVIVKHEHRHFLQAKRVFALNAFPN
jgi:hypothetical protein